MQPHGRHGGGHRRHHGGRDRHGGGGHFRDRDASGVPSFQQGSFNYRVPPGWDPRMNQSYSFRAWTTDITLWSMLTDLTPSQQCCAVILRLHGDARESARAHLSYNEITVGGTVNGVHLDPLGYLMAGMELRYAQMSDETRLAAMQEYMSFQKYPHETIDILISR